jgi:hypothetical protein
MKEELFHPTEEHQILYLSKKIQKELNSYSLCVSLSTVVCAYAYISHVIMYTVSENYNFSVAANQFFLNAFQS